MTAFRGIDKDPIRNFKFKLVFPSAQTGGQARAGFSSIDGLNEETEVVSYREGDEPATARKLPGQTSFDNLVCQRGRTTDEELINWRRLIVDVTNHGQGMSAEGRASGSSLDFVRREITVLLGDYHGEGGVNGAWAWTARAAWPCALRNSELSGSGNDVNIETVEFCHEGLDVFKRGTLV